MSQDRRVVSDTGPLISLEKLGDGFRILRLLYDRVLIPPSVLAEVIHGQFVDEHAYMEHYGIFGFPEVAEVRDRRALPESELLDPGGGADLQATNARKSSDDPAAGAGGCAQPAPTRSWGLRIRV